MAFGLLGNIGASALSGIEGLLGMGQPQPQPQTPTPDASGQPQPQPQNQGALWNSLTNNGQWLPPQAPAAPSSHEGLLSKAGHALFGGGQGNPNDPLAQYRPGLVQEALGTVLSGGNPWLARDVLTNRNINQQVTIPYKLWEQRQRIAYASSIQDPQLRDLYLNNPQAYAEIEKVRLGQTKLGQNDTVYGAGPNGDQTLYGEVTSNPGQNVGDTSGAVFRHNPAAPIVAGPSTSTMSGDTGERIATAPAEPKVVTTPPGSSSDVIYPGQPNGAPPVAAPSPTFNLGRVQANPTAFFSGVFGKPVTISSGPRSPQQNAAVGGVPNSAHLIDQAWDIPNLGMGAQDVAGRLKAAGVPFDQVIDEGDHTHVSLSPRARGMVLVGRDGSYQSVPGANPQPQGGAGVQPVRQGATPHQLVTPDERAAHGILQSDHAGYAVKPDGTVEKTAEDPFGPTQQMDYTAKALSFEPLKNYITTRGFLDAAKQSMTQKGGFADLNLIDMAGKSVNPTLAMRPNMIEQFGKERGWPDAVIGKVRGALEHGQELDDAARNALYNTIYTNTQAHYNAAKGMISKIGRDAAKYGLTAQDLIPDLQEMPAAPAPSYGGGANQQQAIAAAKDAIRRGAPRAAVIKRLRDNGINPAGL